MEEVVLIIPKTGTRITNKEGATQITKGEVITTPSPEEVTTVTSMGDIIIITSAVVSKTVTSKWIVLIVGKKDIMLGTVGQKVVSNPGKDNRNIEGIFKSPIFVLPAKCRI